MQLTPSKPGCYYLFCKYDLQVSEASTQLKIYGYSQDTPYQATPSRDIRDILPTKYFNNESDTID